MKTSRFDSDFDSEAAAERRIQQAVCAASRSSSNLWQAAMYAASVVGRYADGGTRAIADACGKSISQVENWAHAYWLYCEVRSQLRTSRVREWRRELSVSHFAAMYDAVQKWDISIMDVAALFDWLLSCKRTQDSWSVETLRREIDAEYNHSGQSRAFGWYVKRAAAAVTDLLSQPETSRDVRAAAAALLEQLES